MAPTPSDGRFVAGALATFVRGRASLGRRPRSHWHCRAWPKNVLVAGRARLEYRGRIYELVNPRPMSRARIENMPLSDALLARLIGWQFLVADVASVTEGGFDSAGV